MKKARKLSQPRKSKNNEMTREVLIKTSLKGRIIAKFCQEKKTEKRKIPTRTDRFAISVFRGNSSPMLSNVFRLLSHLERSDLC
jgi:hypothetical protein